MVYKFYFVLRGYEGTKKGVVCGDKLCHCCVGSNFRCFARCAQGRWHVVVLYGAIQPVCNGCVRHLRGCGVARQISCNVVQLEHLHALFRSTCATCGSKHSNWRVSCDVFGGRKPTKPPCLPNRNATCLFILFAQDGQLGRLRLDNCNAALLRHHNVPTKRV